MRIRSLLYGAACLVALAAMVYGQYEIRLNSEDLRATALFLAGALAAALFVGASHAAPVESPLVSVSRGRFVRFLAATSVVLGFAAVGTASYLLCRAWHIWFFYGFALLIAGVGLLSLGLRGFDPPATGERRWSWGELGVLLAIVALGGFLRFHHFTEFPDPFAVHAIEEPQTGMGGYNIFRTGSRPWEFFVDHYMAALAIYLSGAPTLLSIRVPFIIFSTLTIIPLYAVLRQLVSRPAATAAAFLFAVSSWNIIYSRCAHNIFLTNFFVVIVLGLLLHFARTRRLAGIPWVGLLAGYTLYAYAGYRGTTIFTLLFIGLTFVRDLRLFTRAPDEPAKLTAARAVLRDLGAAAIVVLLVVALFAPVFTIVGGNRAQPTYYFEAAIRSLANRDYYTSDRTAFLAQRIERVRATSRIFMHKGDGSLTFNYPDEPMLDPLTAICFGGGLLLAVTHPRRRFHVFLVIMFIGLMTGGAVFVQNLDVRRLQGVTPFVAIFAALFLDDLWALLQRVPLPGLRVVAAVLAAAGGIFALGWNYNVYFNKMAHDPRVRQAFRNQYMSIIEYGHVHAAGKEIFLLSDIHHFFEPSDYFFMIDRVLHGRTLRDLTDILPPQPLPKADRPRAIAIQHPYEGLEIGRLLASLYPGTTCERFVEADNPHVAVTACDFPDLVKAEPMKMSLEARYWVGNAPNGDPFLVRPEPFISYGLVPPRCNRDPRPEDGLSCYAEWVGTFTVAEERDYRFHAEVRYTTRFEATIDDQRVAEAPIHLTAGVHHVRATAVLPRTDETGAHLEWDTAAGKDLVPFWVVGAQAAAEPAPEMPPAQEPAAAAPDAGEEAPATRESR